VDIAALAETNSPWQLYHLRNEFLHRIKKHYPISKTIFGIIDPTIDPITSTDKFQAGGNVTLVIGPWTTSISQTTITDPTGRGRWTGITIQGQLIHSHLNHHKLPDMQRQYQFQAGLGTTYHSRVFLLQRKRHQSTKSATSFSQ
jgi:hypothetical protein